MPAPLPLKYAASAPRLIATLGFFALLLPLCSPIAHASDSTQDMCWLPTEQRGFTVAYDMLRFVHIAKQCKEIAPDVSENFAKVQDKFKALTAFDTSFVEGHFKRIYGKSWEEHYKRFLKLSLEHIQKHSPQAQPETCAATNAELQKILQGTWTDFTKRAGTVFPPTMKKALKTCE